MLINLNNMLIFLKTSLLGMLMNRGVARVENREGQIIFKGAQSRAGGAQKGH